MSAKRNSAHAVKKRPESSQGELAHQKALAVEKKVWKYCGIAAIVLIALLILNSFDLLPHLNGTMQYYNGSVRGARDNSIIVCTDRKAHTYYNLGSIAIPEGFNDLPNYSLKLDENVRDWHLRSDSMEGVDYIYVGASPAAMDKMYNDYYANSFVRDADGNTVASPVEAPGATLRGNRYLACVTPVSNVENVGYVKYATAYIEAGHGCSVVVRVSMSSKTEDGFPADETALKYLSDMMDCIKI